MADYDVVLLVEEALSAQDARQVRSLHEGLDDPVTYHVLLPLDDAPARVQAGLGSLSGGDMPGSVAASHGDVDLDAVRDGAEEGSAADLVATVATLTAAGATVATSEVVTGSPTDALAAKVTAVDGREAIIVTRPHVVSEFFHVDWSSQARRKLGVPVLHLVEHESFDEQSGGGEGVTGL